jgi:GT2 family glycosyltransferase
MDESAIRNTVSKGTGAARNQVIRESELRHGRGDYLYLSDNDVYFYPTWLPILIKCYEKAYDFGYRAIGAYNHPYHQPGASVPVYGAYEVREVNALALQSMLMSWETWDKYGPFCQTPPGKVCQSEDVDFTNKLKADGYKLGVVSPALVVNTGITNSFGQKIPGYELVKQQCPPGVICE